MEKSANPQRKRRIFLRLLGCVLVLMLGAAGLIVLSNLKQAPAEAQTEERPLKVSVVEARPQDVQVTITGYGEVRPLTEVAVAPEVAGRVVAVNPRLKAGEVIPKGELLFKIDPSDYQVHLQQTEAQAKQIEESLIRLNKEFEADRKRLEILKRNRELAQIEHERLKTLYEKHQVGTRAAVEQAEQAYNAAADLMDQLKSTVDIYPVRIRESKASLEAARANVAAAKIDLQRTEVRAPFTARVKQADIERGQYLTSGKNVLTLADDSVLEIDVPLDSRDARKWLLFDENSDRSADGWFGSLQRVPVVIRWTEEPKGHLYKGLLHRVVRIDPKTRTLTVAVRVENKDQRGKETLPLAEGMFCSVEIPGKTIKNAIRLPRWAVSMENTVFIAQQNRLKTVPVEVARLEGEEALIGKGLAPGTKVITTRLVDPLENSLLEFENTGERAS